MVRRRPAVDIAVAHLCLALAVRAYAQAPDATGSDHSNPPLIETSGGLGTDSAWVSGNVPFWIRIENHSAEPLRDIQLFPIGDDVGMTALCAPSDERERPGCLPETPVSVPANAERVFNGSLRVKSGGPHQLTMLALAGSHQMSIPLGAFTARDGWWALDGLKDFIAWPLIVGAVGYFYREWATQRAADRKKAEEDAAVERAKVEKRLADERAEAQKKAAEHAETFRIMLPIVHDYAVRYYSDITTCFRAMYQFADAVRQTPGDAKTLSALTFWFLKAQLRNREFYQQVRGFYLTNLAAEEILRAAAKYWDADVFDGFDADNQAVVEMLDALQRDGSVEDPAHPWTDGQRELATAEKANRVLNETKFDAFLNATATSTDRDNYTKIKKRLADWCGRATPPPALTSLWLYGEVLGYETNLLFGNWYGEMLPMKVPANHLEGCRTVCTSDKMDSEWKERAVTYLGLPPVAAT